MAKKKKDNNFFWIGYSDLMTTLFFVMLVLFAVVFISANPDKIFRLEEENQKLKDSLKEANATKEQLQEIVKIEQQFKTLQEDKDFEFLPDCKKYIAKELSGIELFESNGSVIKKEYHPVVLKAGKKIKSFIDELNKNQKDFSYLLVIEGNTANWPENDPNHREKNDEFGFKLSYERALALYEFWESKGISYRKSNVEVIISGSGFNGICRDANEPNNKRFSIQIIPKVSPM